MPLLVTHCAIRHERVECARPRTSSMRPELNTYYFWIQLNICTGLNRPTRGPTIFFNRLVQLVYISELVLLWLQGYLHWKCKCNVLIYSNMCLISAATRCCGAFTIFTKLKQREKHKRKKVNKPTLNALVYVRSRGRQQEKV